MIACRYASIDLVCDRLARKLTKVKGKAISKGKWPGRGGPKGGDSIRQDEVSQVNSFCLRVYHSPKSRDMALKSTIYGFAQVIADLHGFITILHGLVNYCSGHCVNSKGFWQGPVRYIGTLVLKCATSCPTMLYKGLR